MMAVQRDEKSRCEDGVKCGVSHSVHIVINNREDMTMAWVHFDPSTGHNNPRFRGGKTRKDKNTGAWNCRFANQQARAEWQKDNRATNDTFPGKGE